MTNINTDDKKERIVITMNNNMLNFFNKISKNDKNSEFCKTKICYDFMCYGIMWALECFPSLREGSFINIENDVLKIIKRESSESFSFKTKINNILFENEMKGGLTKKE
jgi:hypothetical protein